MKELLETIAKGLVENKDAVAIRAENAELLREAGQR